KDVSQTVWLRLVENLANLREPEALPGWLATTTQRECIRQLRQGRRVLPVDPHTDAALQLCETVDPDTDILRAELHQALRDGRAGARRRAGRAAHLRVPRRAAERGNRDRRGRDRGPADPPAARPGHAGDRRGPAGDGPSRRGRLLHLPAARARPGATGLQAWRR